MTSVPAEPEKLAPNYLAAIAFLVGAGFFAYAFTLRVAPGVMVQELMAEFAVGAAVLGNLSAVYFYTYAVLQIPIGLLMDKIGPRRLMTVAAAIVALGCWMFSTSEHIGTAYAGRALIGLGCAFSWPGTLALVNLWFPNRFALLAGISQFLAMGGAMLGQAPLAAGVDAYGWRPMSAMLGIVGIVLSALIFVTARDRPTAHQHIVSASTRRRDVIFSRQTLLASGAGFALIAGVLTIGGLWGVPFLMQNYSFERTHAAAIMSLAFLGHGCGCVVFGWWSDRIQRRKLPMLVGALLCVLGQCVFIWGPILPDLWLSAVVFVMGMGGACMVLPFALARESADPRHAGLIIGVVNTAVVGSGAVFQPAVGVLLDHSWNGAMDASGVRLYVVSDYTSALSVLPITGAVGVLLILAMRETHATQSSTRFTT